MALLSPAIRVDSKADKVVIVDAAEGEVWVSLSPEPIQAELVTVPGVITPAVTPERKAVVNAATQELSSTGANVERAAMTVGLSKVKIPTVPSAPPCTWFIKSANTPTKLVSPATSSVVGDSARILFASVVWLGNTLHRRSLLA